MKIKSIWQEDPKTLAIEWADDSLKMYDTWELRMRCPCAVCASNSQKNQKPKTNIFPKLMQSVGNYALSIEFSDGHKSGIYTLDFLKNF